MRLKNCGVAVIKNVAMCCVYVILPAMYGELEEFCGSNKNVSFHVTREKM